jgi:hypothetical protein
MNALESQEIFWQDVVLTPACGPLAAKQADWQSRAAIPARIPPIALHLTSVGPIAEDNWKRLQTLWL